VLFAACRGRLAAGTFGARAALPQAEQAKQAE
jgi:hypothetical protein